VRVSLPYWAGVAIVILIFREHSAQNNVQGSARTTWSGKRCCNDMMISLQEKTTQAIRLAPMAECRLYKIAHLQSSRSELRLPYFKLAPLPGHAIIESDQRVISRSAIVLYVLDPT